MEVRLGYSTSLGELEVVGQMGVGMGCGEGKALYHPLPVFFKNQIWDRMQFEPRPVQVHDFITLPACHRFSRPKGGHNVTRSPVYPDIKIDATCQFFHSLFLSENFSHKFALKATETGNILGMIAFGMKIRFLLFPMNAFLNWVLSHLQSLHSP
jgi:hypothetical protein